MEESPHIQIAAVAGMKDLHITVHGHAHAIRRLGSLVFIVLRDSTGSLQVVVEEPSLVVTARQIAPETPLIVTGLVIEHESSGSGVELHAESIMTLSVPEGTLPVEISKDSRVAALSLPVMLDYRPLTLRALSARSIFEIEAQI